MVQGIHKSRTMRRIMVKAPGGRVIQRYSLRRPAKSTCKETGVALHGVSRARPNKMKKTPSSARVPQRPFGGVLSSGAARKKIAAEARKLNS